ncbi:MAG: peptidase C1 [Flavobacteriales bacterium]|nr:peptidase C1 [Flavobacteriales bacterium]|tara:strand:- start:10498 stop:11718 length:1221 start_codon:yes stop_codon:yes gene_type:complete
MKKILVCALLINTTLIAQDKGRFESYSNKFYGKIVKESNNYSNNEKEPSKSFKMDFDGKIIPKSLSEFTIVETEEPISQGNTGTCWCFSTTSFYESEIHRLTGKKINLSELYPVYFEYVEKARGYIQSRGNTHLGEGSETNAVQRMMEMYGIVPFEAYEGKPSDQPFYNHEKMFSEIKTYLNNCKTTNYWDEEAIISNIKSILNHYMGVPPSSFKYKGKMYNPMSFMKNITKLKPNNYVDFMSLLQKPYWSQEEYKVPDNWWRSADYYNVPLDEFMYAIKNSIKNGYSISIGGDVSESGYSSLNDVAMIPSYDIPSEYIDENARQFRFSNGTTTDDHAIHLIGYKIDENDNWWFLIKDSGSGSRNGNFPGYYFYHEDFVKLKMMTFTIHKDAVKETLDKIKRFKND